MPEIRAGETSVSVKMISVECVRGVAKGAALGWCSAAVLAVDSSFYGFTINAWLGAVNICIFVACLILGVRWFFEYRDLRE